MSALVKGISVIPMTDLSEREELLERAGHQYHFVRELAKLNSVLGDELLAHMLQISAASLQRYQNGNREASDLVAARAHFLTAVIAALEGTYNEFGIRRWFDRPRSAFGGRSARQLLAPRWTSRDEGALRVLNAAESLQHLGAT